MLCAHNAYSRRQDPDEMVPPTHNHQYSLTHDIRSAVLAGSGPVLRQWLAIHICNSPILPADDEPTMNLRAMRPTWQTISPWQTISNHHFSRPARSLARSPMRYALHFAEIATTIRTAFSLYTQQPTKKYTDRQTYNTRGRQWDIKTNPFRPVLDIQRPNTIRQTRAE